MVPSVTRVHVVGPYRLQLRFDDGIEGELDVETLVEFQGVFEPLRDPAYFAAVRVDEEAGTIVWPNGADLDPLVLHSKVTGRPLVLETETPSSLRK